MINKKNKNIIFLFGIVVLFFLGVKFVSALEIHYPDMLGHSLNDSSSFGDYICYLFSFGSSIAVSIAVLSVIFGGMYYLVSYGRGKFTDEGKDWVKAGILGLLIVVSAYLIAYTINPALTSCKVGFLPKINFNPTGTVTSPSSLGADFSSYKEIPIGALTENLLTRKIDCYGFDQSGNPIDGDQMVVSGGKKMAGPTYLDHDRADCLTQMIDGAQKKSNLISSLSDEINKLMDQCSCLDKKTGASKCDDTCGGLAGCNQPTDCFPGEVCGGACTNPMTGCKQPFGGAKDCCPTGVKDKIENGPVSVSVDVGGNTACTTKPDTYHGLDEFRCDPSIGNPIKGDYKSCAYGDIVSHVDKQVVVNGRIITLIQQDKWKELNLWQQLRYLKGKIDAWPTDSKILEDQSILDQAKSSLSNCYAAVPYIDLLKTAENTDKQKRIVFIDPETFQDPVSSQPIDISKYCQGFNYDNSSCLNKCNSMCPDTSDQAVQCYRSCQNCAQGDAMCQINQESCIENCYMARPCSLGPNPSQNFGSCMTSCQNDCSTNCKKNYLPCSYEYNFCDSQCKNNGQCVLDNADKCLFGAQNFKDCADQATDQGNTNYCINNSYLCKNGSDQYAGYPDCSDTSVSKCATSDYGQPSSPFYNYPYSASTLYSYPKCQKCADPYTPAQKGTACYSKKDPTASCQSSCPETTKCPTSSKCPTCSCDQINQPVKFYVPNDSISALSDPDYNAGDEGYSTEQQKISDYQMVGPQCNQYSHNDDPLTFYCQDNWWNDPKREPNSSDPIGSSRTCQPSGQVPVGQTIDDAERWTNELVDSIDGLGISETNNYVKSGVSIDKDIQTILDQMIKIGKAKDTDPIKDYCKCGAKFEDSKPICKANCRYNSIDPTYNGPSTVQAGVDSFGNPVYIQECVCNFVPCGGSPCQQVVDYVSALWNDYKTFKSDYIYFYTNALSEPRSDIMKELTYSRQQTNSCSLITSAYGSEAQLLNCTRVEDELIPPINGSSIKFNNKTVNNYCYGQNLGKLFNEPLTDNWFCCQSQTNSGAK